MGHAAGGEYFAVHDPATGTDLAQVAQGTAGGCRCGGGARREPHSRRGRRSDGHARARWLYALARGVQKHARHFAVLETLDNGKPIRETRDIDIPLVARHFYHHAGWAQLLDSEFAGHHGYGVVGQVIPWNFPLLMLAWKVAPALAAGNTVVLKPAEFTPLTALRFAELVHEIGLPPGVFNLVTGDGAPARPSSSTRTSTRSRSPAAPRSAGPFAWPRPAPARACRSNSAARARSSCSRTPISTASSKAWSMRSGSIRARSAAPGRDCSCRKASPIDSSTKLRARMERLRVGSPLDKSVDMGAIVAPVQLERIRSLVAQGIDEGATCWQPSWAAPDDGWFHPPTLFTDVAPSATIAQVEIFGPVLVAMTFRTPDEAVALANNTPFGLAASVWSENINLALDIAPKIKAGVVWINSTNLFDAAAGFGGYRESGFGREGGREGHVGVPQARRCRTSRRPRR